jgi:beta-lactamase class A
MNKHSRSKQPYTNYYYRAGHPVVGRPTADKLPKKTHRLRNVSLILVVVLVAALSYGFTRSGKVTVKKYVKPVVAVVIHKSSTTTQPAGLSPAALQTMSSAINVVISQNSNIDMSVSLIDLTNNQAENYGDSSAFTAASTTKVITAADFLHEVELGQQTLSETINGSTAEYEIQQMIVVSDDNAWDALNSTLGYSQLQSYANSIGVSSFQSEPNTVTSSDMALLLEKLYEGESLNSSDTQLLLSYMKQANYREYIVPAVPSSDTIYHKIGLYEDNVHDEAIITNGQKAFVIVIFTNGNGAYNWPARAQMMQTITQAALAAYF